jgi:HAE1 family hydrophobic/amphiphilic exporter-1
MRRAWHDLQVQLDRHMPVQNLDMLTILGFVILAGVVVNNAILIVHQALNFMREGDYGPLESVVESVRSRVRPILMSTLTSVGGMLPLVLMPGAGSELYRGLGAVVIGGLTVSTIFTVLLVPAVLSVIFALKTPEETESETKAEPATA